MRILSFLVFFLSSIFCIDNNLNAQTEFYVDAATGSDSNTGLSLATPWASIQHALYNAIPNCIINVRAGTYNEKVFVTESGTNGNPIVLKNYNSEEVIIDGTGISSTIAIIAIIDQNYITIEGLKVRNNSMLDAQGILLYGSCSNINIINNEISEINFSTNANDIANEFTNSQPLIVYGSSGSNASCNIVIDNNIVRDSRTGYSEALAVNGNVETFSVTNNKVYNISNIGIDIIGHEGTASSNDQARDGVIKNNLVYNCKSPYATAAGIYVDGGSDLLIEANEIYNCQWGIEIGCENLGKTTSNIVVRNNVVYENDDSGLAIGGFDYPSNSGKVTDCQIFNNTFVGNDKIVTGLGGTSGEFNISYVENLSIENNIFYADNPNDLMLYVYDVNSLNLDLDYNLYYPLSGVDYEFEGPSYNSLFSFSATTNQDQNSIVADPQFANQAMDDYSLTMNSLAIDAGNPNSNTQFGAFDFAGNNRIENSTIDLGAHELQSTGNLVSLRVFLEGAVLANGEMSTQLNDDGLLPAVHPYDGFPYLFPQADPAVAALPTDAVDWVLVEARSGIPNPLTPSTTVVERQAGILLNDGSIVDASNGQVLRFLDLVSGESYYFAVRHRNHLDILSSSHLTTGGSLLSFDFSAAESQAFGIEQLKAVTNAASTIWSMHAGDFNQDGVIQTTDYDLWISDPSILNNYEVTDGNLDGTVQTTDFDTWQKNKAKIGSAEIQY